jgi:cyclopropane fatty-acyl-phospholipid synthase-like methyltransferase
MYLKYLLRVLLLILHLSMQSNDFFALFLDPTMNYSSGIFKVSQSIL